MVEGTLFKHLPEIDQACNERMEIIVPAMAKQEAATEALKAADQMEWVHRMNSICNRAEEIILRNGGDDNMLLFFLQPVFGWSNSESLPEMVCKIALGAKLQPFADVLHIILGGFEVTRRTLQPLASDVFNGSACHFPFEFLA